MLPTLDCFSGAVCPWLGLIS